MHWGILEDAQAYYVQESGRAGRDGKLAYVVKYYETTESKSCCRGDAGGLPLDE